MSKNRRKRQIRNRIIAFIMAVAMVFTVVKVNDSKKEVKAGEGSTDSATPYIDSSYINSTFFNQPYQNYIIVEPTPVKNIYVQNNKIQFGLPDMQTEPFFDVYWFKDGEGNYGFRLSEGDAGDKYIKFTITDNLSWKNGDSSLTCLNKDNTSATLVVTRSYTITSKKGDFNSDEENEYINKFKTHSDFLKHLTCVDENSNSYTKNVITLNYNVSADTKFTVSGNTITDTWTSSETDYYYGENQFVISATDLDGTDETTVGSRNAAGSYNAANINDSANRTTIYPSDGTYYLYHRYVTNINDGTTGSKVWFTDATKAATVTINDRLDTTVKYWAGETKPAELTELFSGATPSTSAVVKTIEGADPTKTISLEVSIDEPGEAYLYKKTGDTYSDTATGGVALSTKGEDNKYTNTITIPTSINGASDSYKLIIRNGTSETATLTHEVLLTVSYTDTRFELADVKFDDTYDTDYENEGTPYLTKGNQVVFTGNLTVGNNISDPWVTLKDVSASDDVQCTLAEETNEGTYKTYAVTGTYNITADALYTIVVEAGHGTSTRLAKTYYVRRDTIAPTVSGVTIKQGETMVSGDTKATALKPLRIEFSMSDAGVGLGASNNGTVEITNTGIDEADKKYDIEKSGDVYYVEIPAAVLGKETYGFISGTSLTYKIYAKDVLGNETNPTDDSTILFYDDKATEVTASLSFEPKVIGSNNYYDINKAQTELGANVTITSKVELGSVTCTNTYSTGTLVLSGTDFSDSQEAEYKHSYNEETKEHTYAFSWTPVPVSNLVNAGGEYSITVTATNANGYSVTAQDQVFFVDLNKPEIVINANDGTNPVASGQENVWNKDVYVVLTFKGETPSMSESTAAYESGLAEIPESFTGSQEGVLVATGVTYQTSMSNIEEGRLVYKVDQNDTTNQETGVTTTGTATVTFTVYDKVGNSKEASATFNVDTTPPTVSVTENVLTKGNYTISATITDNVEIASVVFQAVNADGTDVEGDHTKTFTSQTEDNKYEATLQELYTTFTTGTYWVKITATDEVGNETTKTVVIEVDATSPIVGFDVCTTDPNLKSQPKDTGTFANSKDFSYSGGSSTVAYPYYEGANHPVNVRLDVNDPHINMESIVVTLAKDGGTAQTVTGLEWTQGTEFTSAYYSCTEDGSYTFTIHAEDTLGNSSESTISFVIDKTKPVPVIKLNGAVLNDSKAYNTGSVAITYDYNPAEANPDENDVWIRSEYTAFGSNEAVVKDYAKYSESTTTTSFTAEGNYVIYLYAKDMMGNQSDTVSVEFTVDRTDPVVEINVSESLKNAPKTTGTPTAAVTYTGSSVSATYNYYPLTQNSVDVILTADDVNNKTITVSHTLNGTAVDDNLEWDTTASQSKTITVTAEGTHVFTINATDLAGNTAAEKTVTFTIDSTPPAVSIKLKDLAPKAFYGTSECPVSISLAVTDNNRDVADEKIYIKYTALDSTVTNTTVSGGENPPATTVEDPGTYEVYAVVTDKSGRTTTTDTTTFVIDKTNPEVYVSAVSNSQTAGKAPKSTTAHTGENAFAHFGEVASVNYDGYYRDANGVTVTFKAYDLNLNEDKSGIKVYNGTTDITSSSSITKSGDDYVITTPAITKYGSNDIYVTITDSANQTTTSEHVTFVYDNVKPSLGLTFDGETASAGLRKSGIVSLAYSYTDDYKDAADVKLHYTYTPFNGTAQTVDINNFTSASFPRTGEGDGKYEVTVTVRDMAGMTETKSSWFIIDKAAPQLNIPKIEGTAPKMSKFPKEFETTYNGSDKSLTYAEVYGSSTVKVTIDVFDYDINVSDTSAFVVYDNGKEVEATFKEKEANEYTATVTISGEGSHHITASATDRIGHTGSTNGVSFIIDTTDPSLDLTLNGNTDPEDMLRVDGDVAIGYKLSDTNNDLTDVKITYNFTPAGGTSQGDKPEDLFNNSTRKFTENGTYKVTITAIDKAGNSSSDSASFVIDKQKPEIDLKITTSKPAKFDKYKRTYKPAVENYFTTAKDGYEYGQYYKDNVKVKISVFDYDVKGTVVYDNEDEVEVSFKYEGDGLYTGEFTISEEGSHVIKAESVDKSGNTGKSSELSFIIDKTAPALTTTLDGETYSGTDRFCASDAVVGLKIDDKNQDADDVFRSYVITPSDHSAEKTDSSYVTALQETYKQNAYYTVTYTVVDRAGNSSTAKIGFTIDTTKPQSDIKITTKAPAKIDKYHNEYSNTNGHFNTAYTYGQYYNESVSMDMAVFDYNVAEIIVTDNDEAIPVTFVNKGDERVASSVTVSSEGEHVVKIIVKDKSGNEATSKSVSFIIDKSEPGLSATLNNSSSITEQYLQGDASVYLSVSDTNEDEDDVTRIVKMTRPSASAETSEETGALEGNVSYSTEADYEITYTAIDRAGNKSDPITLTFRVDKTAPQLSFSGITRDATAAEDTTITYNMLEDFYWDMTSATVKIYQKVDGMGETPIRTVEITASGASTALSETFKEDGQYRFEFTAQDKAGNQATESFTFILDENAPVIILSGVDGYLTDQDVNFGVQVDETFYLGNNVKIEGTVKTLDDPKGVKINFDDYSRLTRMASANFEQLFTEDGIYNIKVTSKDVAGNETVQSIQFTIDKSKPLIKDLENLADEEDYQAYSDAVAANDKNAKKLIPIFNEFNFDYDADDIVTDLTTVTYKMYMDGVLYDGLSEIEDGFHTLKITAEDEVGNTAEKSFYFILDTVKPGIIVTGVEEGDNLQEPTTITVSLQLTEDTLKAVNLNGEAIAITNNTATLEVSDKGDYVLVIEAGDDAGNLATLTIKFEYGKTSSMLWLLIAGGAALLIAAATFFIILGKKRKKNQ